MVELRGGLRRSLVVDINGNRDALSAGLEPVEGGLLVGDDEGRVRARECRCEQKQSYHRRDEGAADWILRHFDFGWWW